MLTLFFFGLLAAATSLQSDAAETQENHRLKIKVSVEDGVLNHTADGRIVLLFSPDDLDPLNVSMGPHFFESLDHC